MTSNPTATSVTPRRGKGALVTGVVLLVLGLLAIILGSVVTAGTVKELTSTQVGAAQTAPTTFTSQLNPATTYAVFEAADAGKSSVQVADVTVISSEGDAVTVKKTTDEVVVPGEGGQRFVEVATFDIGTSGEYEVKVATEGSSVAVAPAVSTTSKGVAWIGAVILGGLLAVLGVVLIIVGAVQRSSSRKN